MSEQTKIFVAFLLLLFAIGVGACSFNLYSSKIEKSPRPIPKFKWSE